MSPSPSVEIPNAAFRLRWGRTWPKRPHDFLSRQGRDYCRIYRVEGSPQSGRWFWTAAPGERNAGTGYCDSARQAALAAERAYFAARNSRADPAAPA